MKSQVGFDFPDFSTAPKRNTLMRIIFNADLRRGHPGLQQDAIKLGVRLQDLEPGEFVAFVNSKKTSVKFFAGGDKMLAYFKMPGNRKLNVKVLRILPRYFNGGQLHYAAALDEVIRKEVRVQ